VDKLIEKDISMVKYLVWFIYKLGALNSTGLLVGAAIVKCDNMEIFCFMYGHVTLTQTSDNYFTFDHYSNFFFHVSSFHRGNGLALT
jgi:hypothetical protein